MPADPLAPLLTLDEVEPSLRRARQAVDDALRHRALRRSGGPVAAEVGLRSAVASAALEGHRYSIEEARSGVVTDPVMQGALRVSAALVGLAEQWVRTPRRVLARLHVLAATGSQPAELLGRPAAGSAVAFRLDGLADLISRESATPALLRAAIVHGELLTMAAFPGPNGVVARAAARLMLISAGLDPRGLLALDAGHRAREPEYVGSVGAYATGTRDGVRSWIRHCASAAEVAAEELTAVCDAVG